MGNAETQNRTADTAVFSRMLYQLSYLGVSEMVFYADSRECQTIAPPCAFRARKNARCRSVVIDGQTPRSPTAWLSPRTDADARR